MPPKKAANERQAKAIAAKKAVAEEAGSSKKRKLEAPTPTPSSSKTGKAKIKYIYLVMFEEYGPYQETETQTCGAYTSLKDANNKIIDLWEKYPDSDVYDGSYGDASHKLKADGRMKWNATGEEGDGARAWMKKQELVEETGAKAKNWGRNRPGGVGDGSGEESE